VIPLFVLLALGGLLAAQPQSQFRPQIPHMWDDASMADVELPLPRPQYSLRMVPSEYYYRIPVRLMYKTYPVYARDREPSGYMDRLRLEESVSVFDVANLRLSRIGFARAN
jgi:hypothetical protein